MNERHEIVGDLSYLQDALVLVAVPSEGLVGTIAAQFVIDRLELSEVGYVRGPAIPRGVVLRGGRVGHPLALHAGPHSCGPGSACRNVAVLSSDMPIRDDLAEDLAWDLVECSLKAGAHGIVLFDSWPKDEPLSTAQILVVGAGPKAHEFLQSAGAEPLDTGIVGGFAGSALMAGLDGGLTVVVILTAATPDEPDAPAAARLLRSLVRLARIDLDTTPLEEHTQRTERSVRLRREPVGGPMYA